MEYTSQYNMEDIKNQITDIRNLMNLLSDHLFCLDTTTNDGSVQMEWSLLKNNLEAYQTLYIAIQNKLKYLEEQLESEMEE